MLRSALVFGFVIGMRHALEADHIAAVAVLATRARSGWERVKLASAWGLGHSGILLVIGALMVLGGIAIPDALSHWADAAAGAIVFVLGADVLRRLWLRREQLHTHPHAHGDPHPARLLSRAWLVGTLHGLGGSAAIVLLTIDSARSPAHALGMLASFGVGTVAGMIALSFAISLPLGASTRRPTLRALELAVGLASAAVGARMVLRSLLAP
jgi:hypothetical protein